MENIVKIGNVEFSEQVLSDSYNEGRIYVITRSKIYQIMYGGANTGYYGQMIYQKPVKGGIGFTRRGRFFQANGKQLNDFLGFNLVK